MEGRGGEVYHGIVQRQGGGSSNKDLEFRSWHCGSQGGESLNKEFDLRSWHCGRQGGEV